ncbi:MAG: serine/threonine-protein kinase [Oceanococcaceae bacterium]
MAQLALKPGQMLGHFQILRSLGIGGMAEVYAAKDQKLDREVALKILPPSVARDETLFARFKSEVKQISRLTHPNIVTMYEYGRDGPLVYYSMQLLPGGDLAARLRRGPIPGGEAYRIFCKILDALACAHEQAIVHRDIKPDNVMFTAEGEPVLTDFGIAKSVTEAAGITKTGMTVGTPAYISPEQARGKTIDARTDLYALGVMLYEMLTGHVPFRGADALSTIMKHISEPPPPLPEEFRPYQPLVSKLLAKNPDDRPQSAKQLIRALQKRHAEGTRPSRADTATAARQARQPAAAPVPAAPADRPQTPAPKTRREMRPRSRFQPTRLHILAAITAVTTVTVVVVYML